MTFVKRYSVLNSSRLPVLKYTRLPKGASLKVCKAAKMCPTEYCLCKTYSLLKNIFQVMLSSEKSKDPGVSNLSFGGHQCQSFSSGNKKWSVLEVRHFLAFANFPQHKCFYSYHSSHGNNNKDLHKYHGQRKVYLLFDRVENLFLVTSN